MTTPFPPRAFRRQDESPDPLFYREPRLVTHVDDATIAALTDYYRDALCAEDAIVDLMSSWISHLPPEVEYARVSALGMNRAELEANPRLHDFAVHDLNAEPGLPYPDASFDKALNAFSVQYLTRPAEVFASVRRVLRPGGQHVVAISHRIFPTKAIALWMALPPQRRAELVARYFELAGGFETARILDRSPPGADPLWIVAARRAHAPETGIG